MFSSIAQMFKQQQNNQPNNFKNPDIQKTTFDFDKKLTSDFSVNILNNYNSLSLKQIMNNQGSMFLAKDLTTNVGKTSIRLDDKEAYRKMLNSSNQKNTQNKIINELTKNLLSQNSSVQKRDFSFLLKKNDALIKNNWYNQSSLDKKSTTATTTNQISSLYRQPFKAFDHLTQQSTNNFQYGKRVGLLEKLKRIDEQERTNFVDLESISNNDLNNVVQRNLLINKPFASQQMEYDDNHFGNISKGTSSLCISEAWEDIERDVEDDQMEIDEPHSTPKLPTKKVNLAEKNLAEKIAKRLEEVNLEQNRILKEKENKCKEVEENTRLTIQELEKISKDRVLKGTNVSKLKYYPPCFDLDQKQEELSDIEYPAEEELSDIEDLKEEEDEILITEEMQNEINRVLAIRNMDHKLQDQYGCEIRRKDIETLQGLNWLNDEIINFYFNLLMNRNPKEIYCFNTFFYSRLKEKGHQALKRWTKKVDLFSFKLILIPIHLGMHWVLASISMVQKEIKYYDSMNGNNQECLRLLLQYLKDEMLDKKKETLDTENWNTEIVKGIPQQMNGSDCGMFTCKYADYLARNKPFTFNQSSMPFFRRRMIYEIVTNQLLN